MTWEFRSRRVLAATVSAVALATVLSTTPALAQKTKDKTPDAGAAVETGAAEAEFSIDIPDIQAENSSLDADALRDVLTGNLTSHAEGLATLDADRIIIPTITFSYSVPESGDGEVVYNDLELTDVRDGIAASVKVGGFTMSDADGMSGEFNAMTASDLDIGAMLAFYGMYQPASDEFKTVYRDFSFAGGEFTSQDMHCALGAVTSGEFRARPIGMSFEEMMTLVAEMEAAEDEEPSPELVSRFLTFYVDMLTAFESAPVTFEGLNCGGANEDGAPMSISIGGMAMDGFQPGRYPQLTMTNFEVSVEGGPEAGSFSLAEAVFKSFDFSDQVDVLASVPADADEAWWTQNARSLIPAFRGFSLSGLSFSVPNPETGGAGANITGSVGTFDLTLENYVNGIPASADVSADNVVFELPETSEDETVQQLIAAGITTLDLGFNISLDWDEASETIALNALSLEGAELGSITLSGTLGNAVAELFSTDTDVATIAGMGLTVEGATLEVNDAGMVEIALNQAGKEQGTDAATMRPIMAGVAEGMAMALLGGGEQAAKVGGAIGTFLRGGESLTINVTAKDEAGIGLAQFMAAQEDPTVLLQQVDVDATAQ